MKLLVVETKNSKYFVVELNSGRKCVVDSTNPKCTSGIVLGLTVGERMLVNCNGHGWVTSEVARITLAD